MTLFRFPANWLFPASILAVFAASLALGRLRVASAAGLVALLAADLMAFSWNARVVWAEPSVLTEKPRQLAVTGPDIPAGRVLFEPALIDQSSSWRPRTASDWENVLRIGLPSIQAGYGVREAVSRHQLTLRSHVENVSRLAALPDDDPKLDFAGISLMVRLRDPVDRSAVPGPERFAVIRNLDAKTDPVFLVGAGRVVLSRRSKRGVSAEVEGPGLLVLTETNVRGWRVMIDGRPCPLESFDGTFPAVDVPAGRQLVRFYYRPASFVAGASISVFTFAAGAAFIVWKVRRRRAKIPSAG